MNKKNEENDNYYLHDISEVMRSSTNKVNLKEELKGSPQLNSKLKPGKTLKTTVKTALEALDFANQLIPDLDEIEKTDMNNKNLFDEVLSGRRLVTEIVEKNKKNKLDEFAKFTKEIVSNKEWGTNSFISGGKFNRVVQLPVKSNVLTQVGKSVIGFSEKKKSVIFDKLHVKHKEFKPLARSVVNSNNI
jgi:hypothetical protein